MFGGLKVHRVPEEVHCVESEISRWGRPGIRGRGYWSQVLWFGVRDRGDAPLAKVYLHLLHLRTPEYPHRFFSAVFFIARDDCEPW